MLDEVSLNIVADRMDQKFAKQEREWLGDYTTNCLDKEFNPDEYLLKARIRQKAKELVDEVIKDLKKET